MPFHAWIIVLSLMTWQHRWPLHNAGVITWLTCMLKVHHRQPMRSPWTLCLPIAAKKVQCIPSLWGRLPNSNWSTSQWDNSRPNLVIQSSWSKHHDHMQRWQTCHPQGFTNESSCMVPPLPSAPRLHLSQRGSLQCNALEGCETYHPITCQEVSQLPGEQMIHAEVW